MFVEIVQIFFVLKHKYRYGVINTFFLLFTQLCQVYVKYVHSQIANKVVN